MSLSTRVAPELRERLIAEAGARGMALSALIRERLIAGSAPGPADGAVCNEVECVFSHLPPEAGLRREICLALARTVEAGGTAGIAAGKELLIDIHVAQQLYEPEYDDDVDEDVLAELV